LNCPLRKEKELSPKTRRSQPETDEKPTSKRETRSSIISIAALNHSPEDKNYYNNDEDQLAPFHFQTLSNIDSSIDNAQKHGATVAKKSNARGRRWVRFACEKHRKEHSRCPDNCPMRKGSYDGMDEEIEN